MATRRQVVDDPRSGARPLFGDEQTTMPAPPKSTSTRAPSSRRTAPTKPVPAQTAAATPPAAAATSSGAVPPPAPDASPSASSSGAPTSSPGGVNYGTEGAGAMLALFIFPLAVNLLNGGPSLMWGWVKAKWFNEPFGAQTAPGPSTNAADPQTMPGNPLTKLYTLPTNYPGAA